MSGSTALATVTGDVAISPNASSTTSTFSIATSIPSNTSATSVSTTSSPSSARTTVQSQASPNPASLLNPSTNSSLFPVSSNNTELNNGVSPGAVAGIATGTAFAGAILSLIGAFIFVMFRRKSRKSSSHRRPRQEFAVEKPPTVVGTSQLADISDLLPIPAAESELRNLVSSLAAVIENHVDNFLAAGPVNIDGEDLLSAVASCGYGGKHGSRLSPEVFSNLLLDPATRAAAAQQLIAQVTVFSMSWESPPELSLLPDYMTGFCCAMPSPDSRAKSAEEFSQVFTKWRHMSAYLLSTWRENREAPHVNKDALANSIVANVHLINAALAPFFRGGSYPSVDQQDNLRGILGDAARIAILLFSQPTILRFTWSTKPSWEQQSSDSSQLAFSSHSFDGKRGVRGGNGVSERARGREFVVFPALGEEAFVNGTRHVRTVEKAVIVYI